MPTTLTIPLATTERLFFDEDWPLESLFLDTLDRIQVSKLLHQKNNLKSYTLSPVWQQRQQGVPVSEKSDLNQYRWRVCLLDDSLTPHVLEGLEATQTLNLNNHVLAVEQVEVETLTYEQFVQKAQARAKAKAGRFFDLEFVTPVILHRHSIPFPLPDPVQVFHHYLLAWDTFAPRELWVNINVLDAIEAHLALVEYQLETRQVKPAGKRSQTGFLGQVTYKMMAWEKLGMEFLGTLHTLARFAEFCGTGELTECGLGQTRYLQRGKKKRND